SAPAKPLALLPDACTTMVARNAPMLPSSSRTLRLLNDAPATTFANDPKPASVNALPAPVRSNAPLSRSAGPIALLSTARLALRSPLPTENVPKSSVHVLPLRLSVPAPAVFASEASANLLTWPRNCTVVPASARSASSPSWLAKPTFALPAKTPALVVPRPTRRLVASVAPAPSPATLPLVVNGDGAPPIDATSASLSGVTGAAFVTDTARSATTSPRWTMPKSTIVVFVCAIAGVYTCPLSATVCAGSTASAAPVVPAPLETRFTVAVPPKLPAAAVSSATLSALLAAPAT